MKRLVLTFLCSMFAAGAVAAAPFDCAGEIDMSAPGSVFLQGEPLLFTLKCKTEPVRWTLRNWRNEMIRQSWLAAPKGDNPLRPQDACAVVSEAIRRAGILTTRDRLRWNDVERTPGTFTWKQYQENIDLLSKRGILISGVYHDAPAWAKSNPSRLPSDLLAVYRFSRTLSEHFRGKMAAWEFWNEEDIGFSSEGAWDYAAALKAASLGFKAGNPDQTVAIGGYAQTPLPNYCDIVMRNGVADYFDIFNVHTYAVIRDFPAVVGDVRAHMARHGISGRAIWYTENGSNMEGVGKEESGLSGIRRHSADQEFPVAEYLPKMMIKMQSLGVARDFFFVMPPYNENAGKKDRGLMRRDFTVKPGYAALATLTDRLGNAVLEGKVDPGERLKGFLYRRKDADGRWSAGAFPTSIPGRSTFTPELDRNFQGEFDVNGEFDGRKCSPLVIPLQNLNAQVGESKAREMPQLHDPLSWRKNSSGELTVNYLDAEQAICFDTKFPANVDRWTYPEYELQLPQESLRGAQAIAFEAKSSNPAAIRQMLVMLVLKDKKTVSVKTSVSGTDWKEVVVRIPPEVPTADIVKLRIGINSRKDEIAYCLRKIRIFYAR